MTPHSFLPAAFAALLLSGTTALAGVIPANNASFEEPPLSAGSSTTTLAGWSDAGTDPSERIVQHIAGFNNGGNNHLGVEQGWQVWQDFQWVTWQPFTIYALRAAAGNRAGQTNAANISRIVFTNAAETAHNWTDLNASTLAAGTFGQMVHRHTTGGSGGLIGTPLRVKLESPGTGRSHFDNIRLTSCGTFNGGDSGEGLDLQGDFPYAVNMGTNGAPGQIGDAIFTADTAAGVSLNGATAVIDAWSSPAYGATTNDDRLELAMRSVRHNGTSPGKLTVTLDNLQAGRGYKLQLLFVEQCCDRAFDVKVNGTTIFDDFRLQDFDASGTASTPGKPLVITHPFVSTSDKATIELDGTGVADSSLDRNPTLSAFTLERGFRVNSTADSGPGSLRQALADAAGRAGDDLIGFDPGVFGGEPEDAITLVTELGVTDAGGVTIDATAIPVGVMVSGNDLARSFAVSGTGSLTLRGMTVTKGRSVEGGGLQVDSTGSLRMENCTVHGNAATGGGGGLRNAGQATLVNCTFTGNTAAFGGAITNIAGGMLTLRHCTVTGNAGTTCCGGIVARGTQALENSLVAGNTGTAGPDINFESGTLTRLGSNLIGNNTSVTAQFPAGLPNASGDLAGTAAVPLNAFLTPLADNGGPAKTMLPRPGSQALDRITATPALLGMTDQRGLPRVMWGKADIGAAEAGVLQSCTWEVRDIFRSPATALNTLADAEALVADAAATTVASSQLVINFADPQTSPNGSGYFEGDVPFASNTAADDNDFVTVARTFIRVTEEDDYTFGFSSDDGARLRVFGAAFISSTRLNAANPANPAHSGDSLSFPGTTGSSDTLGVCHLRPGVYPVEFLTWDRNAGAYAEVFAARGAKTVMDTGFRLIGDPADGGASSLGAPSPNGWSVDVIRNGANSLAAAITQLNALWCSTRPVTGLRFTSAADVPARDPMTFIMEGTQGTAAAGPWVTLATGNTGLTTARLTAGPAVSFPNPAAYKSYRLTFPTVRDRNSVPAGDVASMQIAEVEFLDATGADVTVSGNPVVPTSSNSPTGQGAPRAIDNDPATKYLNYDVENSGFTVTPAAVAPANTVTSSHTAINFTDPQAGGGGHGGTQADFPGNLPGDDNNFALGARAVITVPKDGDYTFCILADDSVRLRIPGSRGWIVAGGAAPVAMLDGFQTSGCCADVFGQVFLDEGTYEVELIHNEISGAAFLGLWAAPGRLSRFDVQTARLFSPVGTNVSAGATGVPFVLSAQPGVIARPLNDDFANANALSGTSASDVTCNDNATMEPGEPATANLGASVWWTWTAPAAGTVLVDTLGSTLDTVLSVHTGSTPATLTLVSENDDGGTGNTSLLSFKATAGTVYRLRAGGYNGGTGAIRLQIGSVAAPANDSFAVPTALGSPPAVNITGTNSTATAQPNEPQHFPDSEPASGSVWFTWTAPGSGNYVIDTEGSQFDTVLAVYTGTALNALTLLGADDDSGNTGANSLVVLSATAGVTYRIVIDGYEFGDRGRYYLNITPMPVVTLYSLRAGPAGTRTFNLRWRSEPGVNYQVQSSTDLTNWAPVMICTASEGTETDLDIEGIPGTKLRIYFRVGRL